MWVNRHKLNNSLVVFIHGIFGSRWATWKGVPDLLQEEFATDPLMRSYDSYLFQYKTSFPRQPALDPYVLSELEYFLKRVSNKYHTMTLIAHSQGGILAKLYVLKQLMNGHGETLLVDLIITLGTPHRGRLLLNPLLWCQNIPYVRGLLPFRQLGQLASWSRNIRTLRKHWRDTHISQTPCSPTAKRRYIRSIAVIGAFDRWVSAKSAAGFSVDSREYLSLGHPALAKPGSRTEHLAQLILDQLREHHYPRAILDSIQRIRAEAREHERYVRDYTGMIGSLVRLARPGLGKTGIEIKTASLLNDFLDDFPRRPLRNLVLDTALKTYAERQLGDEV